MIAGHLELQMRETQKLESLGVLAGGIAHDFNNLLVGVLVNAELILQDLPDGSPLLDSVRDIESGASRAADLVRQMLAYAGRGRMVLENVDVSGLVREMLSLIASSLSKKADLRFSPGGVAPVVHGDATQLRQVAMNLIMNGSEAVGDAEGTIHVVTDVVAHRAEDSDGYIGTTLSSGLYAMLEVADTGSGMDGATMERMFEPFFTTKFTGRGLGLAAVLGIVRSHGGAIRVRSSPHEGTQVRVLLPVTQSTESPTVAAARADTRVASSGVVLLADDEPLVRDVIRRMLEAAGLTVIVTADGAEAAAVFATRAHEIDVVVLDLMMPRLNGLEAFAAMRQTDPLVTAILASGFTGDSERVNPATLGFQSFIGKPFDSNTLMQHVRQALAVRAARRAP